MWLSLLLLLPAICSGYSPRLRHADRSRVHRSSGNDDAELETQALAEETTMATAPQSPLMQMPEASPSRQVSEMRATGAVRVDGVLSSESVADLRTFVLEELEKAKLDVSEGRVVTAQLFSSSLSSRNRWDLKLPMTHQVEFALRSALRTGTLLGDTLHQLVGDGGELFELASFVTVNGAGRQVVHADTLWSRLPCLYTCTIALQGISTDMGPTLFLKGSNSKGIHKQFDSKPAALLGSTPYFQSTLGAGDAALYDSRTLHCGGANRSPSPRALFYFTFTNPEGFQEENDAWNVASIREELRGKYRLSNFR